MKGGKVAASLALLFVFAVWLGSVQGVAAQTLCPGTSFTKGWMRFDTVAGTTAPDFSAALYGSMDLVGTTAVGDLDWMYNDGCLLAEPGQAACTSFKSQGQLVGWWSQKNGRNTFVQVTNGQTPTDHENFLGCASGGTPVQCGSVGAQPMPLSIHVQILDENCTQIKDFCDSYTPGDTHVYNLGNLLTNTGQGISEAVLQGKEGTIIITTTVACGADNRAISWDNLFGAEWIVNSTTVVTYGANLWARDVVDDTVTAGNCTQTTGDVLGTSAFGNGLASSVLNGAGGCRFSDVRPSVLSQNFAALPTSVVRGTDVVLINFADDYNDTNPNQGYAPIVAQSTYFPDIYDDQENVESCPQTTTCFGRLGVNDALPGSDNFSVPSPTGPPGIGNLPPIAHCQDVAKSNDPGECFATIVPSDLDDPSNPSLDIDGDRITLTMLPDRNPGGNPPNRFDVGTDLTATLTVTDTNLDSSSCSSHITVTDDEEPSMTCPVLFVAQSPNSDSVPVFYPLPTVKDNCDVAPDIVCDPPQNTLFPIGDSTVTCTATDSYQNVASCTFNITVIEPPQSGPPGPPGAPGPPGPPGQPGPSNVAAVPNGGDGRLVVFASQDGTSLSDVLATAVQCQNEIPAGGSFPFGFFTLQINQLQAGGSSTVTIFFPDGVNLDSYWKYGPTPDNPAPHCYEFLFDGTTGAEFIGNNTVVLHFKDGARGDDDLMENGVIADPGGPVSLNANPSTAQSTSGGSCSMASVPPSLSLPVGWLLPVVLVMGVGLRSLVKRNSRSKG